ncbi:MAG: TonB-dependent receptor plug domain-containing protein [Candidatus Marinimicrobia bacterium]|nr:TonB-dependent receptor plug domain-containing protein [Candidatus Neomarinimicrobiota bacterium]
MKKTHFIVIFSIFISFIFAQSITVSGRVADASTGEMLIGVNIISGTDGTITNSEGFYQLTIPIGSEVEFLYIGYEDQKIIPSNSVLNVQLRNKPIESLPVIVEATRAIEGVTPIAFSTLTQEEIAQHYSTEDVPMILASEPGVHAYSESGNGTGYSYVSIRGFDQSRIAVMVDGVPLNDNESHQVYWVDHGDILSDAKDVQIQRGVGNSLYGSSAFGGSINIQTQIASENETYKISSTYGSFNTSKLSLSYKSGKRISNDISLSARLSTIESDGYRDFHNSKQKSLSMGIEYRQPNITNQLRMNLGYENTDLVWDGIAKADIHDKIRRRESYKGYTDDFLQQIYSLNTRWKINDLYQLTNTAYIVRGKGYYESQKDGVDWYSYNLDVNDQFDDVVEDTMTTDLLQRKWIVNSYLGTVPTFTILSERLRIDIGSEFRYYQGDHFGEISDFTDSTLIDEFGNSWYTYYKYLGMKSTMTSFVHTSFMPIEYFTLMVDVQLQSHDWEFNQKKIGHAPGHKLNALWTFINPRVGIMAHISPNLNAFIHYGKAQKEPADNQIIEADDFTKDPKYAAAEMVENYEAGLHYNNAIYAFNINAYLIDFKNEQLKNIDVAQEGEYEYFAADLTQHTGIEFDANYIINDAIDVSANGTVASNVFSAGLLEGNSLPTTPNMLMNTVVGYKTNFFRAHLKLKYVGQQFLDVDNIGLIDPYLLTDVSVTTNWRNIEGKVMINNVFNILYETYGYGYTYDSEYFSYFWPGATRSYNASLNYTF